MSIHPLAVHLDPDFRSTCRADSFRPSPESHRYRRLVFNAYPLIFAFGLMGVLLVGQFQGRFDANVGLVGTATGLCGLGLAYLLPRLISFHCLDCGGRGQVGDRDRHVCPDVARRVINGTPARLRPPGVAMQVLAELLVLGLLLGMIVELIR